MRALRLGGLIAVALVAASAGKSEAGGNWSFAIGFNGPVGPRCYHGPCHGFGYHYWRPYPVYVAPPPPVIVQPAPLVYAAPVVQPTYTIPAPAPATVPAITPTVATLRAPVQDSHDGDISRQLQNLAVNDERIRADAVLQLGRMKASRAVDPLAATLASDSSPTVREAAARALGLIGSAGALPALQRAAQADTDRDVRNSARFAAEIVQASAGR